MNEEENELKRKEALSQYNMAKVELKKGNIKFIKRALIVLLILLIVGILVRIFYGRIYYSVSFFRLNKSVEYKLYVNDKQENISFEDTEDNPIIPGLLYFRRNNFGVWYNVEKYDQDLVFEDENVKLDFIVNECYTYTDKIRISCDSFNDKLIRKQVKPKFTRLFIRKNGKREKVIYDGKFINDISDYVKEKGYYYIEVYAEYDGIKTMLYLFPTRKV